MRMLTVTERKSRVPTVVDASSGVNTMWLRGLTTQMVCFAGSRSCARRAAAHPVPRITTLRGPVGAARVTDALRTPCAEGGCSVAAFVT